MNNIVKLSLNLLGFPASRSGSSLTDHQVNIVPLYKVQMKWMDQSHSNVNANISLAQFSYNVLLMDSYSTDYYDIAYPGLIMKVVKYVFLLSLNYLLQIHLTRQIGYHIVQTYIPSAVFVVSMSSVSSSSLSS